MLSYRHAFHAGNFADVLKHSVLAYVLEYMAKKEKGYCYFDSHSGAGMYQLADDYAQKTGEYKDGIDKLYQKNNLPPLLDSYVDLIQSLNNRAELSVYPGSPAIAQAYARKQDTARLFEIHPTDFELLTEFTDTWKQCRLQKKDGYKGVVSQMPPTTRRGVLLIDPPYEIKDDYQKAVDTVVKAHTKFATGTFIIWYPVVKRHFIDAMEKGLTDSGIRNILQTELCLLADSEEYGMTGTGLFIVNPPWQLEAELETALPYLVSTLGTQKSQFTLRQLVNE
ncbi:23S rRNA (adenine(2030)-N(6))-methyltransferase RlmJ [Thalassotalea euphylliae]|uniref:23S rRNA (adenine(2030)-N(6))-methyltransferase RlmJ n=1 Tax=Thalassotalea euphylliae TaxID=1655234 RepID=UPI00364121F1